MFNEYGLTIYTSCFGSCKFESMVNYLDRMHKKHPNALIVADFEYKYATHYFNNWRDILDIRNGEDGVIFAVNDFRLFSLFDEFGNFPDWFLSEFFQQRRLHVKVVAVYYGYFCLPANIRSLCLSVVLSKRLFGHFVITKEYDAFDYERQATKRKRPFKTRAFFRGVQPL